MNMDVGLGNLQRESGASIPLVKGPTTRAGPSEFGDVTSDRVESAQRDMLDVMPFALFAVESAGYVLFLNRIAKEVVIAGDGLAVRDRRLTSARSEEAKKLAGHIARASAAGIEHGATAGIFALRLSRPSARTP
ncbi:MAG TPA: hypothetical protein VFZ01_12775, partial [Geminicoccaceae bacterium]